MCAKAADHPVAALLQCLPMRVPNLGVHLSTSPCIAWIL
jgi:hypothetical protein